ncbi:hypothetical protein M432DRAFT_591642 [Thermoascus aurantiacus ATCC 26904]
MIPEYFRLRETMPQDPRVGGRLEVDELFRALCAVARLPNMTEQIEDRFARVPSPYDPSKQAATRSKPVRVNLDEGVLSGASSDSSSSDTAVFKHIEYADPPKQEEEDEEAIIRRGVENLLQAAEEAFGQPGDLPETPVPRPIKQRTTDWIRSLSELEESPDPPESEVVTQSTTSPARPPPFNNWDTDEDEVYEPPSEQTPDINRQRFQYMSHNRRWFVPQRSNLLRSIENDQPTPPPPSRESPAETSAIVKQELDEDENKKENELTQVVKKEPESEKDQELRNIPRHAAAPSPPPAAPQALQPSHAASQAPAQLPPRTSQAAAPASRRYETRSSTRRVTKKYSSNKNSKKSSKGCASRAVKRGNHNKSDKSDDDESAPPSRKQKKQAQPLRRSSRIAAARAAAQH